MRRPARSVRSPRPQRCRWIAVALDAGLLAALASCGGGAGGGLGGNGGAGEGLGGSGNGGAAGGGTGGAAGGGAPSGMCAPVLAPIDTSVPDHVVGNGTAGSCTEAALGGALALGGKVTFACGGGPATIIVTQTIDLPSTRDTVVDGGGLITLDGGGAVRILSFNDPDYRTSHVTVTLQGITLQNGRSQGTAIPTAPPPCSQGTGVDGGGSAIWVRNGLLHVIDAVFAGNRAPPLGPDVGGAIYALGSLGVVVQGSTFNDNTGSNGGAIYCLNSDLQVVNSAFTGNKALGMGANDIEAACAVGGGESGNGGSAAAIAIDGGSDGADLFCGDTFTGNQANELGTVGRTPDGDIQTTTFDRCTFDGNQAGNGGALYFHNSNLVVTASTFSNNSATGSGAIQADGTIFDFTNSTFSGNTATNGLGGALALFGNGGTIVNCTFAGNTAPGGSGLFAAAIAGGTALTIRNTIFDGNTTQDCGSPMACSDGTSSGDGNLQWPSQHAGCATADTKCTPTTTFADAALGALADNGGPTKTCLPGAGSPAHSAGTNCPATDQRGMPRPTSGCTAGAVE